MKAEPLLNNYGGIDRRRAFFGSQSSICFRERNDAFDIAARIENANLAGAKMKYWEITANNLSKAGWSWGCVSAKILAGERIFVGDAMAVEAGGTGKNEK